MAESKKQDTDGDTLVGTKEGAKAERRPGSYGTHTLGAEFNTSGKPSILSDPEFKARRRAKSARTAQNRTNRGSGSGKSR